MNLKRNSSIDFLRIISCIAVILIHVNYYYFKDELYHPNLSVTYVVESIVNIITRFSVPVFVMISGALNLSKEKNADFAYFYQKSFRKIFLPLLIAMIPLAIFEFGFNYMAERDLAKTAEKVIYNIFIGEFFNLWYMYMLVGLYALTPFLVRLKTAISEKVYERFIVVYLVWVILSQIFSSQEAAWSTGAVFAFLAYYFLGDYLYQKKYKVSTWQFVVISLMAIAISFVARYLGLRYYLISPYTGFFSPTVVIFSAVLFAFILKCHLSTAGRRIADLSFYIYVFHTIIFRVIIFIFDKMVNLPELLEILVFAVVTFILSYAAAFCYQWFWQKVSTKKQPSIMRKG